jgi:hypothetical protein
MAGGELHTDRTKLGDAEARQQNWRSAEAATERLTKKAQQARANAALTVSNDEDTLKRATQLVNEARQQDDLEISHRARSEMEEGRGIAMQRPSGVLLADSKKLNAQSNMVLEHSKSTQAKALAALDLKMAQQLADRGPVGRLDHLHHGLRQPRRGEPVEPGRVGRPAVTAKGAGGEILRRDPEDIGAVGGPASGCGSCEDPPDEGWDEPHGVHL